MIPDSWRNSGVAALVRVLTLDVQMTRVLTTPSPGLGLDDCPRIERRSRKMPSPPFQGNFWSSSSSENDIGSPVSIYSKSFVSGTCFSTSSVRTEEVSGVYIDFVHYGGSNCDISAYRNDSSIVKHKPRRSRKNSFRQFLDPFHLQQILQRVQNLWQKQKSWFFWQKRHTLRIDVLVFRVCLKELCELSFTVLILLRDLWDEEIRMLLLLSFIISVTGLYLGE